MMNLKKLLKTPLQNPLSNRVKLPFFIISLIGFIDATYLTVEHFLNRVPPCTVSGCEIVLTSPYSSILGIPVALLGSLYYLTLIVLFIVHFDIKKEIYLQLAFNLTVFGFLFSVYFFILQAFVIHAFCQYCLLSGAISTILFVISFFIIKKHKKYCDSL
jgi:uncharacterized membrane protein